MTEYGIYREQSTQPFGWDLQIGAADPERLWEPQVQLDKREAGSYAIIRTDAELPERLSHAEFLAQVILPTEVWPMRFREACAVCWLELGMRQPVRMDAHDGGMRHADRAGCDAARAAAPGDYYLTTAGTEYDSGGTHTVEWLAYATTRGVRYRRIWIPEPNIAWQTGRNASGMYWTALDTPKEREDLEGLADAGIVARVVAEQAA